MKKLLNIIPLLFIIGCVSTQSDNPLSKLTSKEVKAVVVGDYDNPFESDFKNKKYKTYFKIEDPKIIRKLISLSKHVEFGFGFPFIGILSYQRFVDDNGQTLAETHIVNWDNAVVISDPIGTENRFYEDARMEEFCRIIYNLMVKHSPEEIEKQKEMYKEMGIDLESALFKGEKTKSTAQQGSCTIP